MENRKATEAGQDITMQKEDFAALWKTIHLKVTDTYEVPPEILWVNGSTIELSRKISCFASYLRECCAFSVYCKVNVKKLIYSFKTEH